MEFMQDFSSAFFKNLSRNSREKLYNNNSLKNRVLGNSKGISGGISGHTHIPPLIGLILRITVLGIPCRISALNSRGISGGTSVKTASEIQKKKSMEV